MITYRITLDPNDARHIMAVRTRMREFQQTPNFRGVRIIVQPGSQTSCKCSDEKAGRLAPLLLTAAQYVCKSRTP